MDLYSQRIAILDDEEIFSFSVEHYLNKAGFSNVKRFETSGEFYYHLNKGFVPDVLLLDHFLNDEIGLDILEKLNETHPDMKVVYLSAQKTAAIAVRALKLGAFAYQEKSVTDIKEIIELIKSDKRVEFLADTP
ncbi:MAG: response regulator transcription factor [Flavobacteriales bacterium]|nr:response regulator transcription factor [Flavobacteriales bacterium]